MENNSFNYSLATFNYFGSIELMSGNVFITDPSYLSLLREDSKEEDEFSDFNSIYIAEEIESSELTVGIQSPNGWAVGFSCHPGYLNIFGKFNDDYEERIDSLLFSTVTTDKPWDSKLLLEDLIFDYDAFQETDGISIDSGQVLICDSAFLPQFNSNIDEPWDLIKNAGTFSYQGSSQATLEKKFGVIGGKMGFVSSTGFGDGSYSMYAIENSKGECGAMLLEFIS